MPSRGRAEPSLPSKRNQLLTNPPQEGSQVTWLDNLSHYCLITRRAAVPEWAIKIRSTERAKSPTSEEQELGHNRSWWRRRWRWRWCGRDSHSVHISIWWRVGKITLFAHVEGRFWENAPKSNLSLIVVVERVISHLFKRFSSAGTNRAGRELELVGKIPQEQIWWSQHWWAWLSFEEKKIQVALTFQVLQAPPPPPGLPRAAASRRKKTDARDLVSAPQARARDRMVEALMISQKTRQAPPLLHLNSPWWAQEVNLQFSGLFL